MRTSPRVLWVTPSPPELQPDVAEDLPRYRQWVAARQVERLANRSPRAAAAEVGPEIALLVPLAGADPDWLEQSLASLQSQTVPGWRLGVATIGPVDPEVEAVLRQSLAALPSAHVNVHRFAAGTPVPDALRAALDGSGCPAFAVLGPDDQLAPDAVALLSTGLVDADVVYADEDRVDAEGLAGDPILKPDWSPELCLGWHYLGHPVAFRRDSVEAAGGIQDLSGGDWEHDLVLRVTERTTRVTHVAEVLCRRRAGVTPEREVGDRAVTAALARRGQEAAVEPGPLSGTWHLRRPVRGHHLVSVIIPFRDSTTLLRTCVDSVLATTDGDELELVLVDNGSVEPETLTLLERLQDSGDAVRVHRDPRPFNWAALNNAAVAVARGDTLLFLNDDVEARTPGWLQTLTAQALRSEVAAVGARLLYPNGQVQFAGTVLRLGGAAGHVLVGLPAERPGYLGMAVLTRDVSSVTGACMATRRDVFERLGGFDEQLGVDCNDVDYCLRARAAGLRIVYEPTAELVHHESPSRGFSGSNRDIARFVERWEKALLAEDPFLNVHLTRANASPGLRYPHELAQWWEWRAKLEDP